ncbi:MAG: PIN domain-containing protein [Capsulimonadaceae bacterium]|nr:PIN domain-containing protein [Capsulimonadaceae bacterium]
MILCDAGPLVAILIARDAAHERCTQAVRSFQSVKMMTTEACLAEAFHLLGRGGGLRAQGGLWSLLRAGKLTVFTPTVNARLRTGAYMERYADRPCDYADATLLVAAEDTGLRRIFTIDKHFHAYRLMDGTALEVIP